MAIFSRLTRLLKADIHGLLDFLEEPEVTLRQAIREMEEELLLNRTRLKRLEDEICTTEKNRLEVTKKISDLSSDIALCFKESKAELAKSKVRERLINESHLLLLKSDFETLSTRHEKIKATITEQEKCVESYNQKLTLFSKDKISSISPSIQSHSKISDDDVEMAFLKERSLWTTSTTGENV
jgi:phage shock protein A